MTELYLFEAYGIEIEYMLVEKGSLDVSPRADEILRSAEGVPLNELQRDRTAWSNELALHLVEFKNLTPEPDLELTAQLFARDIAELNEQLAGIHLRAMPGGMHPWMQPRTETQLWPHEYHEIYTAFDELFDCRRHGWSNLQSTQINLPFWGDAEFGRLHAAIRLVLPLIPALAASSPIKEGLFTGLLDTRYQVYAENAASVPELTGRVVPEPLYTQVDYEREVLGPIDALRRTWPHADDLEALWLNARGAIARFDRNAIEIRLADTQECPVADLAVVAAIVAAVRWLCEGPRVAFEQADAREYDTERLRALLDRSARTGLETQVDEQVWLQLFGRGAGNRSASLRDVWKEILDRQGHRIPGSFHAHLELILGRGNLAQRIVAALPAAPGRDDLHGVYARLCDCLAADRGFA